MAQHRAATRRYAGKSAEERDEDRRRRLLDAGLELFGTVGFANSAIETICSRARVATRHFYALFGSKEALLLAVDGAIISEAAARITAALASAPPGVAARVRAGLRAYADVFVENRHRARVHFFDVLAVSGDAEVHRRVTGQQLMDLFLGEGDRFMEQGLIPVRDLSITSGALLGATRYAMTDWATNPDAHDLDEVIDELVRLFVAGLSYEAPTVG
jgi:AcrR family transcriptional regulator